MVKFIERTAKVGEELTRLGKEPGKFHAKLIERRDRNEYPLFPDPYVHHPKH